MSKKTWERLARVERLLAETQTVIRVVEAPWLKELATKPAPEPKPAAPAPAPARELDDEDDHNIGLRAPQPEKREPIRGSQGAR